MKDFVHLFLSISVLLSGILLTAGCNHEDSGDTEADDTNSTGDSDSTFISDIDTDDPTSMLFTRNHVLEIAIEMSPDDFATLRAQTRSIFDVLGTNCQEAPPESPFTYFRANITIDGQPVNDVGIRKKGFYGSLSEEKPSLKVKFSEYNEDQTYAGEERLTLNNAVSDPSYVKQCLGYDVFADAGIPAPRCNFAGVTVNGEYLGVYVNVESIKKRFLRRHFSNDEGHLYEGALSDFRSGWVDTFQVKTNKDTPDRSDLADLTAALEDPAADVVERISPLVDVDAFIRYWAVEYLLMHVDGYARNTNNFYLYNDPESEQFYFIPWGIDAIMTKNITLPWETARPEGAAWVEGILARRLYNAPTYQEKYVDMLTELIDTVWNETELVTKIDAFAALIRPYMVDTERWTFETNVSIVRSFVENRRAEVLAQSAIRPVYTTELRDPMCSAPIGTISGTFNTTFGELDVENPFEAGEATLQITVNGETIPFVAVSSLSGINEENTPAVRLVAAVSETDVWVMEIGKISEPMFKADAVVPIDWVNSVGILLRIDLSAGEEFEVMGIIGEGTLTFTDAGLSTGDVVSGEFIGDIYEASF
ncbi:MAG: CotH kinase family protein [Deltaproteobacteria bacterium]|nr:CotH kinase family protein [Deltaproteobacteria bacterium]MBN2672109.1 CotH kinase family protein [Deltaproteobacteria bacterium]